MVDPIKKEVKYPQFVRDIIYKAQRSKKGFRVEARAEELDRDDLKATIQEASYPFIFEYSFCLRNGEGNVILEVFRPEENLESPLNLSNRKREFLTNLADFLAEEGVKSELENSSLVVYSTMRRLEENMKSDN